MAYQQLSLDQVTTAATGFNGPEGVSVDREGNVYGGGADGIIRKLAPDGTVTELANTGGRPAGMALDRDGNLFVCDPGKAAVLKVSPDGQVSLFADQVGSIKLTLPNFPVFDAEGNLYVSNSSDIGVGDFDKLMAELENPSPKGSLVRLRPDGSGEVAATGIYFANGTAIDPNEEPEPRYGDNLGGLPDGMAFDTEGYMVTTLPMINRLVVVAPDGRVSTLIDDPDGTRTKGPTNCAFGGPNFDDLYIAHLEADHVAKVHLGRKGHPLYDRR